MHKAKMVTLPANTKQKVLSEDRMSYIKAETCLDILKAYEDLEFKEDDLKEYIDTAKTYFNDPFFKNKLDFILHEIKRIDELQDKAVKLVRSYFVHIKKDNFRLSKYLERVERVMIFKPVEENCDTISNAFSIIRILNLHFAAEDIEDDLKAMIKDYIKNEENKAYKNILIYIEKTINSIDNEQDKYFFQLESLIKQINISNRKSNGVSKFFDVGGPYRKFKILRIKKNNKDKQALRLALWEEEEKYGLYKKRKRS